MNIHIFDFDTTRGITTYRSPGFINDLLRSAGAMIILRFAPAIRNQTRFVKDIGEIIDFFEQNTGENLA